MGARTDQVGGEHWWSWCQWLGGFKWWRESTHQRAGRDYCRHMGRREGDAFVGDESMEEREGLYAGREGE